MLSNPITTKKNKIISQKFAINKTSDSSGFNGKFYHNWLSTENKIKLYLYPKLPTINNSKYTDIK